jgi:hypothetical protein
MKKTKKKNPDRMLIELANLTDAVCTVAAAIAVSRYSDDELSECLKYKKEDGFNLGCLRGDTTREEAIEEVRKNFTSTLD